MNQALVVGSGTQGGWQLAPAEVCTDVLYRFVVPEYKTHWGENLRVVGSLPELGNWDVSKAPQMQWHEGHKWVLEIRLPKTTFEFKVIVTAHNNIRWEQGVNRIVETGLSADDAIELVISLTCNFDLTHVTSMDLVLDRGSVEESYELAKATLELLQKRRARLQAAMDELRGLRGQQPTSSSSSSSNSSNNGLTNGVYSQNGSTNGTYGGTSNGAAAASQVTEEQYELESLEHEDEAARLDAALVSQAASVMDMSSLLASAKPGGTDAEQGVLLLPLPNGKVDVPSEVRRIARMKQAQTDSLAFALSKPSGALPPLPSADSNSGDSNGASSSAGAAAQAYMTAAAADVAAAESIAPSSFDMAAEAANADGVGARSGAVAGWAVRGIGDALASRIHVEPGGGLASPLQPPQSRHTNGCLSLGAVNNGAPAAGQDKPHVMHPVCSELSELRGAIHARLDQLGGSLSDWQQLGVLVRMAQARCDAVSIDLGPHEPGAGQAAMSLEELQAAIDVAEARLADFDVPVPAWGSTGGSSAGTEGDAESTFTATSSEEEQAVEGDGAVGQGAMPLNAVALELGLAAAQAAAAAQAGAQAQLAQEQAAVTADNHQAAPSQTRGQDQTVATFPVSQLAGTEAPAAAVPGPQQDVAAVAAGSQVPEAAPSQGKGQPVSGPLPGVVIEMAPSGPNASDTELPVITFRFTDALSAAANLAKRVLGRGQPSAAQENGGTGQGGESQPVTPAAAKPDSAAVPVTGASAAPVESGAAGAVATAATAAAATAAAGREVAGARKGVTEQGSTDANVRSPLPDNVVVEVRESASGVITFRFK